MFFFKTSILPSVFNTFGHWNLPFSSLWTSLLLSKSHIGHSWWAKSMLLLMEFNVFFEKPRFYLRNLMFFSWDPSWGALWDPSFLSFSSFVWFLTNWHFFCRKHQVYLRILMFFQKTSILLKVFNTFICPETPPGRSLGSPWDHIFHFLFIWFIFGIWLSIFILMFFILYFVFMFSNMSFYFVFNV